MAELTNDEIRQKLLNFNYDCGPVTDTTRDILLRKLKSLNSKLPADKKQNVGMSDEELRAELISYGATVAPITSANRDIYMRRLEALRSCKGGKQVAKSSEQDPYEWEPMEID